MPVVFCEIGGNSPGRFKPAITLHIEQLPPAGKQSVTTTISSNNMLNPNLIHIFIAYFRMGSPVYLLCMIYGRFSTELPSNLS